MPNRDPSENHAHDEIWALLPWYINGTLTAAQAGAVEQHLRCCAACHAEVAQQQRLAKLYKKELACTSQPAPTFAQLMRRIEAARTQAEPARRSWWERIRRSLDRPVIAARPAFVYLGLFVAVTIAIPAWWSNVQPTPPYRTLANPGSYPKPSGHDLRVIFRASAQRDQVAALIAQVGGTLQAGPSAAGIYTIRVADGAAVATAVEALRRHPGVLFAEPTLRESK